VDQDVVVKAVILLEDLFDAVGVEPVAGARDFDLDSALAGVLDAMRRREDDVGTNENARAYDGAVDADADDLAERLDVGLSASVDCETGGAVVGVVT
jgi:hypothetical protein